jgi:hypothetical protein
MLAQKYLYIAVYQCLLVLLRYRLVSSTVTSPIVSIGNPSLSVIVTVPTSLGLDVFTACCYSFYGEVFFCWLIYIIICNWNDYIYCICPAGTSLLLQCGRVICWLPASFQSWILVTPAVSALLGLAVTAGYGRWNRSYRPLHRHSKCWRIVIVIVTVPQVCCIAHCFATCCYTVCRESSQFLLLDHPLLEYSRYRRLVTFWCRCCYCRSR